uniref:DALR anticodon binding domain containing 3 n=1 Tax=Anolis carolinensis TaxID=28377 RepID=G1KM93_ANOCA
MLHDLPLFLPSRVDVHLVPALQDEESHHFLRQLRVEWPSVLETSPNLEDILAMKELLLSLLSLLPCCCPVPSRYAPGRSCSVVHVVSHEEAFQQQKVDLLWRLVALQTLPGPQVRSNLSFGVLSLLEYLVDRQVYFFCFLHPDDTWTEIVNVLTAAAIRFEMLSINHQSQVLLDVEEASISTKGTKSGAFVMYNCARLATLFETYKRAEEQGESSYKPFVLFLIQGEWLLLFNGVLPFQETLDRVIQLSLSDGGLRITANTEAVSCVFGHCWTGWLHYFSFPQSWLLCLQVLDPVKHGFQFLLQPSAYLGGRYPVRSMACREYIISYTRVVRWLEGHLLGVH